MVLLLGPLKRWLLWGAIVAAYGVAVIAGAVSGSPLELVAPAWILVLLTPWHLDLWRRSVSSGKFWAYTAFLIATGALYFLGILLV